MLTFAVHFVDRDAAERVGETLRSERYQTELQTQTDGSTVVVATDSGAGHSLEVGLSRMRRIADEFGGDFIGHGGISSVGLGQPRP